MVVQGHYLSVMAFNGQHFGFFAQKMCQNFEFWLFISNLVKKISFLFGFWFMVADCDCTPCRIRAARDPGPCSTWPSIKCLPAARKSTVRANTASSCATTTNASTSACASTPQLLRPPPPPLPPPPRRLR